MDENLSKNSKKDLNNSFSSSSISNQKRKSVNPAKNYKDIVNFGIIYSVIFSIIFFLFNSLILMYMSYYLVKNVSINLSRLLQYHSDF